MAKVEHRKYNVHLKDWKLEETIAVDCENWEKLKNKDAMFDSYLYLNKCSESDESGMYQLVLNGMELYYGTLNEINAIVKTMIRLIDKAADYEF